MKVCAITTNRRCASGCIVSSARVAETLAATERCDQRRGHAGRSGLAAGRLAVSESLARSALVKRAGGVLPLRETAILVALVNHPALAEENFDAVESLDLFHPDLRQMHAVLIDALAHGPAGDRLAILQALQAAGCLESWERAVEQIRDALFVDRAGRRGA